jgi:L-malate glycosyltransferase
MRIAFVYDAVYPWEKGGAQKRVWEIARRLAADHDVHLYGLHYWDGPATIIRNGVTLHGVCEPPELYVGDHRSIYEAIYYTAHLTPALLRNQFDVIDCQQFPYFPIFSSKANELMRSSAVVVTWYEVWNDYWYQYLGWKGALGKAVERLTVRLPDQIIAISEFVATDLEAIGRWENVTVVHNGVDYEWIQNVPAGEADWDVVYVGRLIEHKNVDKLLEAVAIVAEEMDEPIRCGIIGDGPQRTELERYARELGVSEEIEFLGFVETDAEVIEHLKAADVFVLPSMREGFPNTILEANACGVPSIVVDHDTNGATAVVEDGVTGYVMPLSSDAIAAKIREILTNNALRADLQQAARNYGRDHDWSAIVEELEVVYTTVACK